MKYFLFLSVLFLSCQCKKDNLSNEVDGFDFGDLSGLSELNVKDFGADNSGMQDNTALLQALHATGKQIYYPNGTYRFNGNTLDLSSKVRFESNEGIFLKNDISEFNLFQHDDFGNFVGLIQNPMEEGMQELNGREFSSGYLMNPPLFNDVYKRKVDFIAWWYNDFGLECTRTNQTGWIGWYYWGWNHHDCLDHDLPGDKKDPYDPSRHPLLGFYKGDDPVVLDWQSYWMLKYGVNVTGLISTTRPYDSKSFDFENPGHKDHWMYELLNNAPNFKKMKFLMSPEVYYPAVAGIVPGHVENNRAYIMDMIDKTYGQHPDNVYTMSRDGQNYPVMFLKEEGAVLWTYDNPNEYTVPKNTIQLYKDIADKFRQMGYPGIIFMVSNDPIRYFEDNPTVLDAYGVYRYACAYSVNDRFTSGSTYPEIIANYNPSVKGNDVIMPVATSLLTKAPHQSNWTRGGHSPELFRGFINKALEKTEERNTYPAISCYNVSEWAEGGPGLVPNMQDRFAYLEAIKETVMK